MFQDAVHVQQNDTPRAPDFTGPKRKILTPIQNTIRVEKYHFFSAYLIQPSCSLQVILWHALKG
jgi:hypothetical protein